jgi:hypothetical protein
MVGSRDGRALDRRRERESWISPGDRDSPRRVPRGELSLRRRAATLLGSSNSHGMVYVWGPNRLLLWAGIVFTAPFLLPGILGLLLSILHWSWQVSWLAALCFLGYIRFAWRDGLTLTHPRFVAADAGGIAFQSGRATCAFSWSEISSIEIIQQKRKWPLLPGKELRVTGPTEHNICLNGYSSEDVRQMPRILRELAAKSRLELCSPGHRELPEVATWVKIARQQVGVERPGTRPTWPTSPRS